MKRIITIIVALVAMASGTKVMAAEKEAYAVFTSGNSTLSFYYDDRRSEREGDKYSLNSGTNNPGWIDDGKQFTEVVFALSFADYRPTTTYKWFNDQSHLTTITNIQNLKTEDVTVMSYMFYGCSSLTRLDVSHFDTSNATSMSNMFCNCSSLTRLDLSSFDTSNVTDMSSMFFWCVSLTSLDLSHFDTSKVTDMNHMFTRCKCLTSLDLSHFDTSNVTDMKYMFYGCDQLTSLDVSNFDTSKVTNMQQMFMDCSSLTSLDLSHFDTSNVIKNMSGMFSGCSKLTSLDLSSFDTSKVTGMGSMFEGCSKLTTVNVGSEWSTDKVTSSNNMFKNCTAIKGDKGTTYDASHTDASYAHIDGGTANPGYFSRGTHAYAVSDNGILSFYYDNKRNVRTGTTYDVVRGEQAWIDVRGSITKVVFDESFQEARPTSTYSWFRSMSALTEITGIENLNTSEVDNMQNMFFECTKLTSLDLSSFNTEKVTGMNFMFYGCSNLTSLDLSSFNTRNVTTMGSMFSKCSLLKTVYVGSGWTTESLTSNSFMFTGCTSLVGGQGTTFDSNYTKKEYAHIDGGPSNPGYFTRGVEPEPYAQYHNGTLTFYYDKQKSGREGDNYSLNTGTNNPGWIDDGKQFTEVVFAPSFANYKPTSTYKWFYFQSGLTTITNIRNLKTENVTDMSYMFFWCGSLTSLDVSHFDTSNVTNMGGMFSWCDNLTSLDVSSFDTSNVTNMGGLFCCDNLTSLDVSSFDTSNVTDMSSMFSGCSFTSLDLSNFDTSNVADMGFMFNGCSSLTSLDVSNFDTSKVTDMQYLFSGCSKLTSLDLSNFDTSKVTEMTLMFGSCSSLTSLDLSNFNTSNVKEMGAMFKDCSNLTTVYIGSMWSTSKVTSSINMFNNCTAIKGGQGTTYDASHINKDYAHIDGGPSNPGYFTSVQGVVTGIGEAFNSEASPLNDNGEMINDKGGEWYLLDGRRVLSPQKGHIYIRGGKKVIF